MTVKLIFYSIGGNWIIWNQNPK